MPLLLNINDNTCCSAKVYKTAEAASREYPKIPWDVLDSVLSHGGSYNYSTFTITRVHSDYVITQ